MEKYLIMNADDFGLSPAVSEGIIQAVRFGTISSVSLMVNMPGFKHAVQLARQYSSLSVGLHFNPTYGKPVSPPSTVPSLIDSTAYFSRNTDLWVEDDIETELTAQWKKLIRTGIHPSHIDSHHHIKRFQEVKQAMVSLAINKGIPMRRMTPTMAVPSTSSTDYLISGDYSGQDGLTRLLGHLKTIAYGVTELVCHPGLVDEILIKTSSWTYRRENELRVFLDHRVKLALKMHHILLIGYDKLNKIC